MRLLNQYRKYIGLSSTLYAVVSLSSESLFTRILVNMTGPDSEQDITNFVTSELLRLADQHWDIVMENRVRYIFHYPRKKEYVHFHTLRPILFFLLVYILSVSVFIAIGLLYCN